MLSRPPWTDPSPFELESDPEEELSFEANRQPRSRGAQSGRWVRRGSRIIVLGLEVPAADQEEEWSGEAEIAPPTLRRGSKGQSVSELQQRLKARGFDPGQVDGIFGPRTDSAVRAFQRARRLTVDGIVGPQTWGALLSGGTPGTPPVPPVTVDRWVLPPDVRAEGERQNVRYDEPGSSCSGAITPGARQLGDYIRANFPGVTSVGGYSCRPNTANSSQISLHAVGRALDIMISPVGGRANSAVGDPIANWLVRNAATIGVQFVIWNRVSWGGHRPPPKDSTYTGPIPHIDHVHAELNQDGANRRTPWFRGGGGTPGTPPTGGTTDWTRVTPDQRMRHVMQRLVNQYGYPVNAAAGIVGNVWGESQVIPNRLEGSQAATPMRAQNFQGRMTDFTAEQIMNRSSSRGVGPRFPGVGLAQWTSPDRRRGLFEHVHQGRRLGANILFDMDAQVDYLVTELRTSYQGVNRVLTNPAVTVEDASDEVVYNFERPASVLENGRSRPRTDPQVQEEFRKRREFSRRALQAFG